MLFPLSFSPIAITSSPEEAEALFREQFVTSHITRAHDTATFGVEMNGVSIGNSALSFIRHSSDYEVDCDSLDGEASVIFGYGSGRPSTTSLNGQSFNGNDHGLIITRNSKVTHKRARESYEYVFSCPATAVERKLQSLLNRHLSRRIVFGHTVEMRSPVGVRARSAISNIMNRLDSNPQLLESPLVLANFEDLLLEVILSLPSNYSDELFSSQKLSTAPSIVTRAEAFMNSRANTPITMSDVFTHVGCSRNTLFNNFRKFRGYTPWEFLTTTRLELVHQQLLAPQEGNSVTSIAQLLGFSHMGRFSQMYRKRYGERPSETIKRAFA
ncbi:MAG: helix-turn-helix transcriptional regulator [Halioglobus sp.]